MSWEAVTWASKQRMKLPHEQLILLVLANCADPSGVAFAEWPGREHWWKYLVDRTRLSKSSLFRHINTLVDLGLCARSMMVMADGTRRPTLRLDLNSTFDIEDSEQHHSHEREQSHGETGEDEADHDAANINEINDNEGSIESPRLQSHGETVPTGGTEPFPIVGMHKESSLSCSKESPPTPQGGGSNPDDGFEEFRKAWARPIERLSVALTVWSHVPTAKRGEVVTAARGYWAWLGKQITKPPPPVSAQTFLRESTGWAQWLPYAPTADGTTASIVNAHPRNSPQGAAIALAYQLAGLSDFVRDTMTRNGAVNYLRPVTPRLLALAMAPMTDWPQLNRQQAAAWEEFLRETVTVAVRKHLKENDRAPWPWPPSAEGKIYATGPPEGALMGEADFAELK